MKIAAIITMTAIAITLAACESGGSHSGSVHGSASGTASGSVSGR